MYHLHVYLYTTTFWNTFALYHLFPNCSRLGCAKLLRTFWMLQYYTVLRRYSVYHSNAAPQNANTKYQNIHYPRATDCIRHTLPTYLIDRTALSQCVSTSYSTIILHHCSKFSCRESCTFSIISISAWSLVERFIMRLCFFRLYAPTESSEQLP